MTEETNPYRATTLRLNKRLSFAMIAAVLVGFLVKIKRNDHEVQKLQKKKELSFNDDSDAKSGLLSTKECLKVFTTDGQGGMSEFDPKSIDKTCQQASLYNVCDDLKNFTGLTDNEVQIRLARLGRFHFEGEHKFWNPKTKSELAWYYATSVNYLFANAIHGAYGKIDKVASKEFEPVLDYAGGVGNNILHLAKKGIKCQYFGIGMMEYKFAQYRVMKNGFDNLVEFKEPYSAKTGFKFDPINGPLPRDGSLGSIIAMDVLEHIPNYHVVVKAMVESLKVGGIIIENSPFDNSVVDGDTEDTRVHLSNGGISMKDAMGSSMNQEGGFIWKKIKE